MGKTITIRWKSYRNYLSIYT